MFFLLICPQVCGCVLAWLFEYARSRGGIVSTVDPKKTEEEEIIELALLQFGQNEWIDLFVCGRV